MKIIARTPGIYQAPIQCVEKMMSDTVMDFGHICLTVTDIYRADSEGTALVVTCFDGQNNTDYRLVQSSVGEWDSVTPALASSGYGLSVEDYFRIFICGQEFQCSKVNELFIIKVDEIYQAVCNEGKYRLVKEKDGMSFTVTSW